MSPRWQLRSLLTSLPLTKRTADNYSWIRYHSENPRIREWGWGNHREQDWMHQKGKESSYMLTALSLPKASTAPCQAVFSEPPFPPAGKENPGGTTSSPTQHCGSLCGNPYSSLAPQGLQGNLWDSTTGTLTIMKGGEGLATTSTWILAYWSMFTPVVPK